MIVTILMAIFSIVYGYGFLNGQVKENRKSAEYNRVCIDNMYDKINRIDRSVSQILGYMKAKDRNANINNENGNE